MTHQSEVTDVAVWSLLAAFGGAVKYISAVLRSPDVITHRRFMLLLAANAFISSFCGLIGGLLMTTFTDSHAWQYIACGLFGYIGTQSLDWAMLLLRKKIVPGPSIATVIPVPPEVQDAPRK